jgi:Ca2+-binding EF-hand superfamily protein
MPNFKVSDQLVRDGKDISALLRKCIYDPPLSFEDLAAKFRVSVVNTCPHISFIYFKTEMKSINGKLTNNDIDAMWALMNPNNSGTIDLSAIHKFLQNRYGKDKKSNPVVGIIERVKTKILARCGQRAGIKGLQRTLSIMDDNGDKRLSKDELKFGLRDYGIELNLKELDDIFQYFDRDHNGFVDITEFLVGMRGDLNDRRREIVSMAFNVLDKDRSGYVTVDEIADVYDVSADPDVVSGRKTTNEALRTFLGQWESGEKDGIVTLEEFEDYYKEISASIDGDDYFELMVRNAWRIAGGKGNAANTANLRVLVTDKSGKQSVVTLENELGLKAGDKEEIKSILLKQGVDAASIDLKGGIDKDDGGTAKKRGSRGSMQRAVHSVFRGLK